MRTWLILAATAISAIMAGCSGGGSTCASGDTCCNANIGSSCVPTSPSSGASAPTISVSSSSTTVTSASPATITATVDDADGAPVSGSVVNFTVTPTIGSLSATAALTDSNGQASVLLSPATSATSGADLVTATATVAGTAVSASVGYQLSSVSAAFGTFTVDPQLGSQAVPLPAYGQTQLTLNLTGVSSASPAALVATSDCVARGKATISPASVTNTTGVQTFIYKDTGGCGSVVTSEADTVTVSITGSSVAPATTSVYLTSPAVNSITFDSATPQTIYLKGSGYAESSLVKFKVVDSAGNPLPNEQVGLTLSTFAGGLTMDQLPAAGVSPPTDGSPLETKKSDADGFVSVIVNSGTVPTPVRVIATLADTGINTVSSNLAVVTGLPSQLNFSLSQQTFNIEGWNLDGTANSYTIRAADRSGNPVPDGTSIVFWAEGGQVQGTANTLVADGTSSATANFVSQAPRPADGRITVVAYAIGEESFIDLNGNNVWDTGEPFQDLGDVSKDVQYDNHVDPIRDEYVSLSDLNATTKTTCQTFANYPQFTLGNSIPSIPGTCDGVWSNKTYVRRAIETVLSTSTARLFWAGNTAGKPSDNAGLDSSCTYVPLRTSPAYIIDPSGTVSPTTNFYNVAAATTDKVDLTSVSAVGDQTWYTGTGTASGDGTIAFLLSDENPIRLNPVAAGSTITATTSTDNFSVSIAGGTPVGNTPDATTFLLAYKSTGATAANVSITVTSPSGVATTFPVTIILGARGSACPDAN